LACNTNKANNFNCIGLPTSNGLPSADASTGPNIPNVLIAKRPRPATLTTSLAQSNTSGTEAQPSPAERRSSVDGLSRMVTRLA
jgi:hypothetical protein